MNLLDEGQAQAAPLDDDIEHEINSAPLVQSRFHHNRGILVCRVMGNQRGIEPSLDQGFGDIGVDRVQNLQGTGLHGQSVALQALAWQLCRTGSRSRIAACQATFLVGPDVGRSHSDK